MKTFASSHTTRMHNTAAVELGALQTSNGLDAKVRAAMKKASTSSRKGKAEQWTRDDLG